MDITTDNNTLIESAFNAMRPTLGTFIMREMIRNYHDAWWEEGVLGHLYEDQRRDVAGPGVTDDTARIDSLDILLMLRLIAQSWKDVFRPVMDRRSQSWAHELIDTRNSWAYRTADGFSDDDTERALDTMARFMDQIDPETAVAIRDYRRELMGRHTVEAAPAPEETRAQGWSSVSPSRPADEAEALRPWRSVVAPKDDVARGQFKTAEFAIDLANVAKGEARFEYQDPKEFFSRTYITQGMRSLLMSALKRVSVTDDDDGDPVVELKTAFGGGKTHSMLAVYHLMRTSKIARELPGVAEVMDQARVPNLPDKVYVATLVGTDLDPSSSKNPQFLQGKVNTLWGEMAYQLCLQKGDPAPYAIIRSADSKGVAPGADALKRLFDAIGPCVILMDEFVAYARTLYDNDSKHLPAGTFENLLSFLQQLTEAVKRTKNCMLIASLPESERELGGEGGKIALQRVEQIFGRVNSIWRAATNEEGFEIVKKRLFGTYDEGLARSVVDAFMAYYAADPDKFPVECRDEAYRDRMMRCYPIHPQVFDRLYSDWSTLPSFQRTRGVLRLMATVIHNLWEANDADPLIMPGSIDFSDARISEEIFQYLDPAWNAVVDTDVDGAHSIPGTIDRGNGRFSRPKAARRMARAIFLGSAPTSRGESLRGLDVSDVRLGAAVPGTNVTIYDDALAKMRDELSYLYTTGTRYWYDTHPTLEKLARDRASRQDAAGIEARVVEILRQGERRAGSGFANVNVCPLDGSEVPDEPQLTLVVVPPSKTVGRDVARSAAVAWAADCLTMRGGSMRANRNMLLFAAADSTALDDAQDAVRRELAWRSIDAEADALELTRHARDDARAKLQTAAQRAQRLVLGAYKHLVFPQQDPGDASTIEWDAAPISGNDAVSKRAYQRAKDDGLVVEVYTPFLLQRDLDSLLLGGRDCVAASELWDDYCRYCYLRRLRDGSVLAESIANGATTRDFFGYADGRDEDGRFLGLRMGERPSVDMREGLVVARQAALEQLAFDREREQQKPGVDVPGPSAEPGGEQPSSRPGAEPGEKPGNEPASPPEPPKPVMHDMELEATLDQWSAGSDVGTIVEEILQRLYDLRGSSAHLTLSAEVSVPGGIDDTTLRIVTENAKALGVTIRVR
ncbi:hypothetical protein AUL39_03505 [Tractidigestivibacter scatoligenes]|uniref:Swt1-like HEPN domain-containing protein n=1 Tax=Tractidigestivibacter scatoligenes TaxID=1299998 RepID=A0A100YXB2_TRASO|nr:DUF499 domain-containing protein [Tractidigestivibacter scatoligenes]KUH59395.1 hypothetical protein AUL39_03505 [Tractidigestivibacter scatoligenes]